MTIEYITLGGYLIILVLLGLAFRRMATTMSDFVRGGGRGTWWLVGSSMTMAGISAFTFTGNGSAAFEAGPTFLIIYVANCAAYLIGWLFLGAWYRQTRAYTVADVIRGRFGTAVEQFSVYSGLALAPLSSAIQLWALAMFTSAVFGFPLTTTIIVIGGVVVAYSTLGGRWAVMATDFVQGVLMMAITTVMAFLALKHIGGIGEFFSHFTDPRFVDDFRLVKEPGQFNNDRFTWKWIIVIFLMQIQGQISLNTAGRFLAVKDGREASRASLLAFVFMFLGSIIWFVPPMVARFMYGDEIMAQDLSNPSESAYAYIALQLLPNGLMGIMIAAMFSATMSSMDSGLNVQAGVIVRNLIPRLRSGLGLKPDISDRAQMLVCYISTLLIGGFIIICAILFARQKEIILFDAFLLIGSVIGLPLAFPKLMGLWIKRIPFWSYFVIFGACMAPSLVSFYDSRVNGLGWTIQDRAMWIFIWGTLATFLCIALNRFSSKKQKEQIEAFFVTMHTPVDFEKEIGQSTDYAQARLIGVCTLLMAAASSLLLLVPNDLAGRLWIIAIVLSIASVGAGLMLYSRRHRPASPPEGLLEELQPETPLNPSSPEKTEP
jgi:solute:Na+ symporter, SSS family